MDLDTKTAERIVMFVSRRISTLILLAILWLGFAWVRTMAGVDYPLHWIYPSFAILSLCFFYQIYIARKYGIAVMYVTRGIKNRPNWQMLTGWHMQSFIILHLIFGFAFLILPLVFLQSGFIGR